MSIYFRLERRIDSLALVISSSIVDLEPFFVLLFNLQQPPHGFWHSYFGVLLLSVPLTLGVYLVESKGFRAVERAYKMLKIDSAQVEHRLKVIFYTNLIGVFPMFSLTCFRIFYIQCRSFLIHFGWVLRWRWLLRP